MGTLVFPGEWIIYTILSVAEVKLWCKKVTATRIAFVLFLRVIDILVFAHSYWKLAWSLREGL
jgi:hypothetical protein